MPIDLRGPTALRPRPVVTAVVLTKWDHAARSAASVQQVLLESLLSRRMALVTLLIRRKRPIVGVAARKGRQYV